MAYGLSPLVSLTKEGLYCEAGDFYIDPSRGVGTAIVTHAHSDHARRGSRHYICANSGEGLLRARLGQSIQVQTYAFGEVFRRGDVRVSLHSAGHILGSAQVRIEKAGEVWVVSGDYKRDADPSCDPFEIVPCETFITEATFGTPKYKWNKSQAHGKEIAAWWGKNAENGKNSLLFGYSLGKAQRILSELAPHAHRPILIHESMVEMTECYRRQGRKLASTREITEALAASAKHLGGELILAPPSILKSDWIAKLGQYRTAFASGWMSGGAHWQQGDYDDGFVISDHADWDDLNRTISETGARRIFVQHRNGALVRHLRKKGLDAHPVDALIPAEFHKLGGMNLPLL